jgi:hypothetical protein
MKKIFLLAFLILIGISSCTEDESEYKSNGTILGVDFRECFCCGGYFIDIDDSTYRFDTLPLGSKISLDNPVFPIPVKLDWEMADTICLGDEINVLRITKR